MISGINEPPEELRALKQWVCWNYEERGGKPTKVPYTIGGYRAESTNPRDWYSYDEVEEVRAMFSGIGFVFSESDSFCGIDLDDCLKNGEVMPWATEIVEKLSGTYSEISPSGNGLKFFVKADLPFSKGKKVQVESGAVEIYDHARYFTVTGDTFGPSVVQEAQDVVDWLSSKYFKPETNRPQALSVPYDSTDKFERALKYLEKVDPAIEGQNASGVTYRAACTLARGFALSEEQVFNLLYNEYNPRCRSASGQPNPWTEQELRRKASEGMKSGGPLGSMLAPRAPLVDPGVDLSKLQLGAPKTAPVDDVDTFDDTDEEFFQTCIPPSGLVRDIFDYYFRTQSFTTYSIGLATAISIIETILGRRVQSHTGIRTNDYNIVVAGTSSGKESCERVSQLVIKAGLDMAESKATEFILAPDVQSGNALLREISELKSGLWICDEFGKHFKAIVDTKSNNGHAQQIGTHLLKLYGKADSVHQGAAHSDGRRSPVIQPHLCLLGMSTWSVFDSISESQIEDGLYGRLSFWPSPRTSFVPENRPEKVPQGIAKQVAKWIDYKSGLEWENPAPTVLNMSDEALNRWNNHFLEINKKQLLEPEFRAGVWGRVAVRSQKLAMVHRCSRLKGLPDNSGKINIEINDIEWGIRLSNRLARISCSLASESITDTKADRVSQLIIDSIRKGKNSRRDILRSSRRVTAGDVDSAVKKLEASGAILVKKITSGKKPKTIFELPGLESDSIDFIH